MIDAFEGPREVEEHDHRQITRIQCHKYVGKNFKYSRLCQVVDPIGRLKVWQQFLRYFTSCFENTRSSSFEITENSQSVDLIYHRLETSPLFFQKRRYIRQT